MIKEHDCIVLTEPIPAEGLEVGDVGTVVGENERRRAEDLRFIAITE